MELTRSPLSFRQFIFEIPFSRSLPRWFYRDGCLVVPSMISTMGITRRCFFTVVATTVPLLDNGYTSVVVHALVHELWVLHVFCLHGFVQSVCSTAEPSSKVISKYCMVSL